MGRTAKKINLDDEKNIRLAYWWQVRGRRKNDTNGKVANKDGSDKDESVAYAKAMKVAQTDFEPGARVLVKPRYYWAVTRTYESGQGFVRSSSAFALEDAVAARDEALRDFESGKQGKGHTLKSWGDHCLERLMPEELEFRTIHGYRQILENHVYPSIGRVKLEAVTTDHILLILDGLAETGAKTQTRRNVRYCVSKLYSLAQLHRKVPMGHNPADPKLIKIKKEVERDDDGHEISHKRTFAPEEYRALLGKAEPCVYGAILLGLYCGLRIGEVVGLRWANVDLDLGLLHVREQVQFQKGKGLVAKKPKTASGVRTIPLPSVVLEWLKATKFLASSEYVVPNGKGKPFDPSRISEGFREAARLAGLYGKTDGRDRRLADPSFHDLRHTFCYYMANGWVKPDGSRSPALEIAKLAKIAGHASTQTTLGYYIATTDRDLVEAMQGVG